MEGGSDQGTEALREKELPATSACASHSVYCTTDHYATLQLTIYLITSCITSA